MILPANMLQAVAAHCLGEPTRSIHLTDAQIRTAGATTEHLHDWARTNGLTLTRADRAGWPGYDVQAAASSTPHPTP